MIVIHRLVHQLSKVLLKVILSRLRPHTEAIIAEEQAGFRAGRSTSEQIFNLRISFEKYTINSIYISYSLILRRLSIVYGMKHSGLL